MHTAQRSATHRAWHTACADICRVRSALKSAPLAQADASAEPALARDFRSVLRPTPKLPANAAGSAEPMDKPANLRSALRPAGQHRLTNKGLEAVHAAAALLREPDADGRLRASPADAEAGPNSAAGLSLSYTADGWRSVAPSDSGAYDQIAAERSKAKASSGADGIAGEKAVPLPHDLHPMGYGDSEDASTIRHRRAMMAQQEAEASGEKDVAAAAPPAVVAGGPSPLEAAVAQQMPPPPPPPPQSLQSLRPPSELPSASVEDSSVGSAAPRQARARGNPYDPLDPSAMLAIIHANAAKTNANENNQI